MPEPSSLFFPLRTSVELFRDPLAPAAHLRAKQGTILFDELTFEIGIYDVSMVAGGSFETTRSADALDDDALLKARTVHETSTPMTIAIGVQPARGVPAPASAMRPIMQGAITRHYVAEWESVLRALEPFEPKWAKGIVIDNQALNASPAAKEIAARNFACLGDQNLLPDVEDHLLREWTYKSFNRDAVVAEEMEATVNITARFWPMIDRADLGEVNAGDHALECFVANLGEVSWENVIAFRDHAGAREARKKLKDYEKRALSAEPGEPGGLPAAAQPGNHPRPPAGVAGHEAERRLGRLPPRPDHGCVDPHSGRGPGVKPHGDRPARP